MKKIIKRLLISFMSLSLILPNCSIPAYAGELSDYVETKAAETVMEEGEEAKALTGVRSNSEGDVCPRPSVWPQPIPEIPKGEIERPDEQATSGNFGASGGFRWTYDESTDTLTITGEDDGIAWLRYSIPERIVQNMKKVVFENCVAKGSMSQLFSECDKLKSVDFSGLDTTGVTDMGAIFISCGDLTDVDLSVLDTSNVTDMSFMFYICTELKSVDFSGLDTSSVTDMSYMFALCGLLRSVDLSGLNTSKVTDMSSMFSECDTLESVNISGLDTSSVRFMGDMFCGCERLNSVNLSGLDTSNVRVMSGMFQSCQKLVSIDLSGLDTSNVVNMSRMFSGCNELNSVDISCFDTSNVTDMSYMFYGCKCLRSVDLSCFDTSNVTNMRSMFYQCERLRSVDVSDFDTSNVTDMGYMFYICRELESVDLSDWCILNVMNTNNMFTCCDSLVTVVTPKAMTEGVCIKLPFDFMDSQNNFVSEITSAHCNKILIGGFSWVYDESTYTMTITGKGRLIEDFPNEISSNMKKVVFQECVAGENVGSVFRNCKNLTSVDLSGLDTSKVTSMSGMFSGCSSLGSVDLSGLDTSNVTSMSGMFFECSSLISVDLSSLNTSNVTSMSSMFWGCSSLGSVDLSGLDTSNVTSMSHMFYNCSSLTSVDLRGLNTSKVTFMMSMFDECSSLVSVNMSGLDTSNLTDMTFMFDDCSSLTSIDMSGLDISNVTEDEDMLLYCEQLMTIATPKVMAEGAYISLPAVFEDGKNRMLGIKSEHCNKILTRIIEYDITYHLNGGKNHPNNPRTYTKFSKTIKLKEPQKTGYTFDGWYSNKKCTKHVKTIQKGSTGDKTLYAKWKAKNYDITYKLNGGKNSSKNPKKYTIKTSTITLKKPTKKGYKFVGWYSDKKLTKKVTKIQKGSTGKVTLYAKWKKE